MSYALQHLLDHTRRRGPELRPRIVSVEMLPLGAVGVTLDHAPLTQGVRGERWRIRSRGRCQFRFASPDAYPIVVAHRHPVLSAEVEPWDQLTFSGKPRSTAQAAGALHLAHARWSSGHVALDRFVNTRVDLEKLLAEGFGVLAEGPRSYVAALRHALLPFDLKLTVVTYARGEAERSARPTALFLGASWFVATDFRAEPIG